MNRCRDVGEINNYNNLYELKPSCYYQVVNPKVISLLEPVEKIIEVGCAEGLLGKYILQNKLCNEIFGIEIHNLAAEKAKKWYQRIFIGNVESMDLSQIPDVDAIVCADLLEHLIDPWVVFSKLVGKLKSDGYFILSIPNARHIRFWFGLVFHGRFDYQETGLLDRAHLRFFTMKNLQELFKNNSMYIEKIIWNKAPKGEIANYITLGLLKEFLTFQFVFRLRKKVE